jgi:hypothetical protein
MESSRWENLNHLFCHKVSFLTYPHCRFRVVCQGMKQTYLYLWHPLLQAQWDRCEFFIDNIFTMFQQTADIPMGINCAPLLADLFVYSHEADFIQGLLKKNEKKLARHFNVTFHYIDDVLSMSTVC